MSAETTNTSSEEAQIDLRRGKAVALRERGVHPYGNGLEVPHTTADVKRAHGGKSAAELTGDLPSYTLAGRVTELRSMGKIAFLRVLDRDDTLQVMIRKDAQGFSLIPDALLDRGDIVRVVGKPIVTKTGELSLEASELTVLTKALRPLPEKWHGITDPEIRFRRRYVDLFTTPGVRDTFVKRAKMVRAIRRFLDDRGYVEVETPTLHEQAGGAAARPFQTHHNALDLDLNLRIATELHLKRLVVGGLDRVYEIGRIFRNEGIDRRHNPEFTSIEFYEAHATYADLMTLTEEMLVTVAEEVTGAPVVTYQGQAIDFTPPYPRVSMIGAVGELLVETWGLARPATADASGWLDVLAPHASAIWAASKLHDILDAEKFAEVFREKNKVEGQAHEWALDKQLPSLGEILAKAFEELCESRLDPARPVFVVDFPLEVSPLARKRDADGRVVDRFELYVAGMELANAFSELNDPDDQRARFQAQVENARKGDDEAMPYDEDFCRALEHGMPPTAGQGIGIDRLAMVLTDAASIRDVILFPLLRPEVVVKAGEETKEGATQG